jgi:hypothetical protein
MSDSLPERPNLEQLKKQAKSLLRFAALPAFAKISSPETYALPNPESTLEWLIEIRRAASM